ncbi:tripartite tricarboxylate transporter substrate binding protein [Ramlibacter sp. USB13]|uniref:Tripartite tricarboxylate transporter substrate binding protein n=1 Tax=Ramlibacter cellulosilyticus TaxID=2764187 RepID=A0A923MRX8_9BURK|nr:tripartite tricarboxylate transporter substrate binding protein [Ramlibacter cellulosilyticus]MBC5784370.1 tripartite tricarboxylate transporter substrate binding protein [Ramlibacter cellulosilyticus]
MKILKNLLAAAACAVLPFAASAQAPFPSKPVTIVVPNAPGGAIDILARLLEKNLSETWKQPVIVQYKPGAGTVMGTDFVAKSAPDGHTIGMVITGHMINPSLRRNMPFDTLKDLSGVSLLATSPIVLTASPRLPANNLPELIALAKKDKLSYASPGSGSSMHLGAELLKTTAGVEILHTPYKGAGGAYPDVMAGRVDLLVDPLFSSLPHIKSGGLKPIAIMSARRSPIAPNIPTVAETLPGFVVESVFGAVVPSGTPKDVVQRISADMNKVLQSAEVKQRMADIGLTGVGNTPEQFDAYIRTEIPRWAQVVKASGATAD